MVYDAPRLCMAIHNALRQMPGDANGAPTATEFAVQARRIAQLETLPSVGLERGVGHLDAAAQSLLLAEREMAAEQNAFLLELSDGARTDLLDMHDRAGFLAELECRQGNQSDKRSRSVAAAVLPARQWAAGMRDELAVPLAAARRLQALAARVVPLILVVDDDEFQHRLMAQMLAVLNVDLAFAVNGVEALAGMRKRRPDLILMDIGMPEMSGVEVMRRLKMVEQFAAIPVVMITGESEKGVVVESIRAGAAGFLVKPVDRHLLLSKMRELLPDTF
jgi:CheY-like chemotaxis protein